MAAVGESDGIRAIRELLRDDDALREVPTRTESHWAGRVFEAQTVTVRLPTGRRGSARSPGTTEAAASAPSSTAACAW